MKKESGQAVVLIALLMVVLFGFAALSIDIGSEVAHAIKLQKAADAASLAAASAQTDSAAEPTLSANQIPPTDTTNVTNTGTQYTVTISEVHNFLLASVLGIKNIMLTRSATANLGYYPLAGYAIFNGSQDKDLSLQLGGTGSIKVTGGVHSNGGIDFNQTGQADITGNVTLDGSISGSYKIYNGSTTNNSYIMMPGYPTGFLTGLETEAKLNNTYYNLFNNSDGSYGTLTIDSGSPLPSGVIYVNGYVVLNNNGAMDFQNTAIYASQGITITSNGSIGVTGSVSFALYSGGNIILENNGSVPINGLIYTPSGSIATPNNGTVKVNGSIVGSHVDLNGSGTSSVTWTSFDSGFQYFPQIAHLIQ